MAVSDKPLFQAYVGSLVADALAMPVHWFYDRREIDQQYGWVDHYMPPQSPHAGSIMFRSHYTALNEKGDILGDQAQYWGQAGIHYHQFLEAGENTVNYKLAIDLFRQIKQHGGYESKTWLQTYIDRMLEPSWHGDTYLEEYHRGFFTNYAKDKAPEKCGISDIHIGGLAHIPALLAGLSAVGDLGRLETVALVEEHVRHTHNSQVTVQSAIILANILLLQHQGLPLREAIEQGAKGIIGPAKLEKWSDKADREVIGRKLSPACYLPESLVASLFLAWKYHQDFESGIIANAMVGGDSCHRGAVVGALLAAENGMADKWIDGLVCAFDG